MEVDIIVEKINMAVSGMEMDVSKRMGNGHTGKDSLVLLY